MKWNHLGRRSMTTHINCRRKNKLNQMLKDLAAKDGVDGFIDVNNSNIW